MLRCSYHVFESETRPLQNHSCGSLSKLSSWCGHLDKRRFILILKLLSHHGVIWMNEEPNLLVPSVTNQDLGRWGGERGGMGVYDTYQVWFCRRLW